MSVVERRWAGPGDYTYQGAAIEDRWQRWSQAAYDESQLIETRSPREESDVRAEVEVFRVTSETFPSDPNWIPIFVVACGVLPAMVKDEVHMRTTYKNFDGDTLLTVENSETITEWLELFLVVLMPFDHPRAVEREVYLDLNRSAIAAAHERGVL